MIFLASEQGDVDSELSPRLTGFYLAECVDYRAERVKLGCQTIIIVGAFLRAKLTFISIYRGQRLESGYRARKTNQTHR